MAWRHTQIIQECNLGRDEIQILSIYEIEIVNCIDFFSLSHTNYFAQNVEKCWPLDCCSHDFFITCTYMCI